MIRTSERIDTGWITPNSWLHPDRACVIAPGDILIHRAQVDPLSPSNSVRLIEAGAVVGFAVVEHCWHDPVEGQHIPEAGDMVALRVLGPDGPAESMWKHARRELGLAGYYPATGRQAKVIRAAMADRAANAAEARPWAALLRELGLNA